MEETELRERLDALAERTAPPPQDPGDVTEAVLSRHRTLRRRQWAVAAAVVAFLVVVPTVQWAARPESRPAAPAPSSGVYTVPTRGSLAADGDFVEGVRRLPWTTGPWSDDLEAPLDTRRVVYASDVPGARWALVAGASPTALPPDDGTDPADLDERSSIVVAWFTGSSDAAAEGMSLYGVPHVVEADEPTALVDTATGVGVVVAAPGDRVEVSRRLHVDADGLQKREFTAQPAPEGIAVTQEAPVEASIDWSLRYRVTRGNAVFDGPADAYPNRNFTPPAVDIARLRPAPSPAPGDVALTVAVDEVLSRTAVPARRLSFTVLWAGDLPVRDGGSARATVLAVEFAEGGLYVLGAVGGDTGGGSTARACGSETRPAGTPLDEQVVVVRCEANSGPTPDWADSLVVVAPPGTASAQALDPTGKTLAEYPLVDGVAVVPLSDGVETVRVLDADGNALYDRAPMGHAPLGE